MRRCLLTVLLGLSATPAVAQTPLQPVVLRGAASPAGGTYSGFYAPVLTNTGRVAFRADLTGAGSATTGAFAGVPGAIQTIAVRGGTTPAGGTYSGAPVFSDLVIGDGGVAAFRSGTIPGGPGIFAGPPNGVQTVALTGTTSPAGGSYANISTDDGIAVNAAGRVAVTVDLTGGPTGAVFVGLPGAVQPVAVQGAATPVGGTFTAFSGATLNLAGQAAFLGNYTSGGSAFHGVFLATSESVQAVAVPGTPSPGGGMFVMTGGGFQPGTTLRTVSVNAAGQVAFTANVLANGTTVQDIVAGGAGSLQHVARSDGAAPGGGTYSTFETEPLVNAAGEVAFVTTVRLEGGALRRTLVAGTPGAVQFVAQEFAPAPGGGLFGNIPVFDPALNAAGQVAFVVGLTGEGVTTADNEALFAGRPGELVRVVRKGDVVDVDPGPGADLRTVSDILFSAGSGGEDGLRRGLADDGTLVFRLSFTDGTSGVFTSAVPVPEPGGVLAAAALSLLLAAGRRWACGRTGRAM